jgi:chromosome segregation ATPase
MYQRKLMEKEAELRRAWGKWKELHSMIRIGAYHYRNIVREITDIRYNVIKARKEAGQMKTYLNYNRLIHEVAMIRNSIAKEKCMINALTEQMRHPINIHRWRVLEATHPEAYELVQTINLLTKRLVDRNANIKEQNVLLDQKQKLYVEIRACIERSPGLEVPEEVEYCKCLLAAKRRQFETLKKDVNSAENQTAFYRDKVKELNFRMMELKQKYFATLKRQTFRNPGPGCPTNFLSNCARAKTSIT